MKKIHIKNMVLVIYGLALITVSSLSNASTLPYAVFEGNNDSSLISTITGTDVTELAKVEGWDLPEAGASLSSDGLTITGTTPFDGSGENEYITGSWSYSGAGTLEWLVINVTSTGRRNTLFFSLKRRSVKYGLQNQNQIHQ